jgi:uncharacterized membrane protein
MMKDLLLILASFLASSVEMVEAMTIILAVGVTRGWRASLTGAVVGFLALAVTVGILGPSLVTLVPLNTLRIVVGTLLLIFGMQWLRKAIQRSAGLRSKRNEALLFENEVAELDSDRPTGEGLDWTGVVVSFKGVFLEGLEVAFVVLTFGANGGSFGFAAAGAITALAVVSVAGIALHAPLSRVPENTIKFTVGLMLMGFGTFWGGEGVGIDWKLADATILVAIAVYSAVAFGLVEMLKRREAYVAPAASLVGGLQ